MQLVFFIGEKYASLRYHNSATLYELFAIVCAHFIRAVVGRSTRVFFAAHWFSLFLCVAPYALRFY